MNEKYAITIGRQFGSGGLLIGERLSEKLGINCYDKNLINIAAQKSGICKEFFEKLDENRKFGVLNDVSGWVAGIFSAYSDNNFDNDTLFKIQSDIIKQLARKDSSIFVGRCAGYVLREKPRVINIFICADMYDKSARIAEKMKISHEEAVKIIEETDKRRLKYYEFYSSKKWGCSDSYHLCVNSSVLGIDGTADFICSFVKEKLKI